MTNFPNFRAPGADEIMECPAVVDGIRRVNFCPPGCPTCPPTREAGPEDETEPVDDMDARICPQTWEQIPSEKILEDMLYYRTFICSKAKPKCKPKFVFSIEARAKKSLVECIHQAERSSVNFFSPLVSTGNDPKLQVYI